MQKHQTEDHLWKKKVHYVDYKWEWISPDMDSTCKYAKNNLTTKTVSDTALGNGYAPNKQGAASYEMSQRGSKLDEFLQWKEKSMVNLEHVVISYTNVCTTSEVQI
jgi:hypothetical protein